MKAVKAQRQLTELPCTQCMQAIMASRVFCITSALIYLTTAAAGMLHTCTKMHIAIPFIWTIFNSMLLYGIFLLITCRSSLCGVWRVQLENKVRSNSLSASASALPLFALPAFCQHRLRLCPPTNTTHRIIHTNKASRISP